MRRLKQRGSPHRVADLADTPIPVGLAGLILLRGQPEVGADRTRFAKACRIVDCRSICQGDQRADARSAHQPVANLVCARDLQHLPVEPGELAPQRCPCRQHRTDHRLQSGVTCGQLLDTRLEPAAADLADLQSIAAQDTPDAELDVEQLPLQKLATDEYGAGILRR